MALANHFGCARPRARGLAFRARRRRGFGPLILGAVAAGAILLGKFVLGVNAPVYTGTVLQELLATSSPLVLGFERALRLIEQDDFHGARDIA